MAMWRGTDLVLTVLTAAYHVESVAKRQATRVANDEILMTKLEGMTNDRTADFRFRIRASNLFRHSAFVLRHSGVAESER